MSSLEARSAAERLNDEVQDVMEKQAWGVGPLLFFMDRSYRVHYAVLPEGYNGEGTYTKAGRMFDLMYDRMGAPSAIGVYTEGVAILDQEEMRSERVRMVVTWGSEEEVYLGSQVRDHPDHWHHERFDTVTAMPVMGAHSLVSFTQQLLRGMEIPE